MNKTNVKKAFDEFLGTETIIKRKRRTKSSQKKELFLSIIKQYDLALDNSLMLSTNFKIDLSTYEDPFYQIIDKLIILGFGQQIYELVSFYFYERYNDDGTENCIIDEVTNQDIFIRTPEDLYTYIVKLYPNTFE